MENLNYIRVSEFIPKVKVADINFNAAQIKSHYRNVPSSSISVLPELSITGCSCKDLFSQKILLKKAKEAVLDIARSGGRSIIIVGSPELAEDGKIYNSAFVLQNGSILGVVRKKTNCQSPFTPWTGSNPIFDAGKFRFGVEIGDDKVDGGVDIVFNIDSAKEVAGGYEKLVDRLKNKHRNLVYVSAGFGESSQDYVHSGNILVFENYELIDWSERFSLGPVSKINDIALSGPREEDNHSAPVISCSTDIGLVLPDTPHRREKYSGRPFKLGQKQCEEVINIQALGLAKRISHTGLYPVLGVSGGTDSTWALLVIDRAIKLLGESPSKIVGVTMPGLGTSDKSLKNSLALMKLLGVTEYNIPINDICQAEFKALDCNTGVVFENVQARARTAILMNLSNKIGGFMVGTGDMSELALGWCTYNGDQMSMYSLNGGLPKTVIRELIENYNTDNQELKNILTDILGAPISPELVKGQVTEDIVGPYELHDFFLYYILKYGYGTEDLMYLFSKSELASKYSEEEARKWLKFLITRLFSQQFKRSSLPDGPDVLELGLRSWNIPSDACPEIWLS